ncbi:hypothetical protein EST38_g4062 [Candolleomyces aberdarensis]|uniref:Fungal-type protein kinase domain-containing protein n=1 Tax=Candolleomyces aberdarensis TaxID=2316362 RepID=A0A4Q2DNH3_9AGAR|nr:hypothetical protein EST38_g4062 [Candolleomyces aberdarensis]
MANVNTPATSLPQAPQRLKVASKIDLVDFAVQVLSIDKEVAHGIHDKTLWMLEEPLLQSYKGSKAADKFLILANTFLTKVYRSLARGRTLKPTSRANIEKNVTGEGKGKRGKRGREEDAEDEKDNGVKRARRNDSDDARTRLSDQPVAVLPLELQCLACNSRYFIVEIKVRQFKVTVAYYDQFLEFVVAAFDFRERPGDLALILYGTNATEARRFGVEPHLLKWSPYMPVSEGKTGMFFFGTHKCVTSCGLGGFLRIPSVNKPTKALDSNGLWPIGLKKDWVDSYFEIRQRSGSWSFKIVDVLQQPAQLLGNATVVYKVKLAAKNGVSVPAREADHNVHLLKVSWPSKGEASEQQPTWSVLFKLDSWPEEVLKLTIPPVQRFKASYTAENLDLLCKKLDLNLEDRLAAQLNRELRVELEDYCRPWCEVDTEEELVEVWRQCVESHNDVWKKTKFLHRNINDTSIMFYRKNGKVHGVLKDWDGATKDGNFDRRKGSVVRENRTFMAIDLLADAHEHLHRHDLEAFFYALVWATAHYDLKVKSRRSTLEMFHLWEEEDSFKSKHLFMNPKLDPRRIESWGREAIRPEFHRILHQVITPLRNIFMIGFEKLGYWEQQYISVDFETCGGALAYGTFMMAIRKFQKELKEKEPCQCFYN